MKRQNITVARPPRKRVETQRDTGLSWWVGMSREALAERMKQVEREQRGTIGPVVDPMSWDGR